MITFYCPPTNPFNKKTCFYFLSCFFVGFSLWTYHYVGQSNLNQLISTIVFGFSGLLSANKYFTLSIVRFLLLYPLAITVLLLLFEQKLKYYLNIVPSTLMLAGLSTLSIQYDIPHFIQHLHAHNETDYFAHAFNNPKDVTFHLPKHPQNLVLIYVESLEANYQNTQLFDKNLLQALDGFKQPHISFQQFKQTRGADWTMGGIVSSQCGIPLKLTTLFNGNDIGSNVGHFLPGAICLSDVLANLGYHNVFMKGAALSFAGTDTFLKTHHYHEMLGKETWLKQGFSHQQMTAWGLPDDMLFEKAKKKLRQLIQARTPFNLTLLTVDTHGVDGLLNQTCAAHGGKNFEDIVECSANQVADFVHYVNAEKWSDKVTIIIMGDHLAMKNAAYDTLTKKQPRHIFNLILSNNTLQKNRDTIFHVDLFPTILSALGITWTGTEKLALGYSALAPMKKPLSTSEHFNTIEKIEASNSKSYHQLWTQPN
ncbi:MAG: sulfatase-like hydrolase/transferase [Legionellaceae bacterium]|nr:sulfatase-like hydrolase/transferase [Legionellaceae bacterium]